MDGTENEEEEGKYIRPPKFVRNKYHEFNIEVDMKNPKLKVNMREAFNNAILVAQDKQIITLLEMIKNYLMKRMTRKIGKVAKWKHPMGSKIFK